MALYAAALTLLLHRRDAERNIPSAEELSLDDGDKVILLSDLAWRLSLYGRSECSKTNAIEWMGKRIRTMPDLTGVSVQQVFNNLLHRSGVIREPIPGRIDFVHRTFQEYLAAAEAASQDHMGLLITSGHLDQWRETVIMACGHANIPLTENLLGGLLDRADEVSNNSRRLKLLAASCLETAKSIPNETLRARIDVCLDELTPPKRLSESVSLASAGLQVLNRLPQSLTTLSPAVAAATVRTACLINGPEAMDLLSCWGSDSRPEVIRELVAGWSYFDPSAYAQRVLFASPLERGGSLTLREPDLFPCTLFLPNLKELHVTCRQSHLDKVPNIKALKSLEILSTNDFDAQQLPSQAELRGLAISGPGTIRNPALLPALFPDLTDISIPLNDTDPSIDWILQMPKMTFLRFENCGHVTRYPDLSSLANLKVIGLHRAHNLTDLRVLGSGSSVNELSLTRSSLGSSLEGLPVQYPRISDITLRYDSSIESLSPLAGLDDLRYLDLEGCNSISDVSALAECENLLHLDIRACLNVTDLRPLSQIGSLQSVIIFGLPDATTLFGSECRAIITLDPEQAARFDLEGLQYDASPAYFVED